MTEEQSNKRKKPTKGDLIRAKKKRDNMVALFLVPVALISIGYLIWKDTPSKEEQASRAAIYKADTKAENKCASYIRAVATVPSSVKIKRIVDTKVTRHDNGRRTVRMGFSAKNAFGTEVHKTAYCLISPNGDFIEATIQ